MPSLSVASSWIPLLSQAAAAGKHVLCEKPCAVTLADLQEMSGACAAAGKVFMDGVMFMHDARLEVRGAGVSQMPN